MARQTTKLTEVSTSAEISSEFSAPLPSASPPPLSKREAAKSRQVSLKQCAVLLNRDRNTVQKYLDQGCPYVEKADRDRGVSWLLDVSEVVKWLEERAAKNVADRMGGETGQIPGDEADRRIKVAKMITEETGAAEAIKAVARVHDMLDLIKRDYSELRVRLMSVPDALAAKVPDTASDKVRTASAELIRNALSSLRADKEG